MHSLEDYIGNLRDQGYEWAEEYHQQLVAEDALWDWLKANETLPNPYGLWVIDVRDGGVSPEYDAKLAAYSLKEQARAVYDGIMVVVDRFAAAQAA